MTSREKPVPTPAIVIHGLCDAEAALAAAAALGVPVTLISAPGAAAYAGPAWFRAVVEKARRRHPDVAVTAILDCGDMPGHVLAALRAGVRMVRFAGPAMEKIGDIAAQYGAAVLSERPRALDLDGATGDRVAACRKWLEGHRT